jgi:ureidoglycolate dehydrogenase (NAD+)
MRYLDSQKLTEFVGKTLQAAGLNSTDAGICADNLTYASLRGLDGHGVLRLGHYLGRLALGSTKADAHPTFERKAPSLGLVDGHHAMGQVSAWVAMHEAIKLAQDQGIGLVLLKNGGHFGAAGYYGCLAAGQGMQATIIANGDKIVVPFGGSQAFFGSNPLAFVFPTAGEHPVAVDMATSGIPYGKVVTAKKEGKKIPDTWGVDAEGKPTEDPAALKALYPMAGHKGYSMALAIEAMTSLVLEAPYGPDIPAMYGDEDKPRLLSQAFLVIDVARFLPLEAYQKRFQEMADRLHNMAPAQGFSGVLLPGEPETLTWEKRKKEGIPIEEGLWKELDEIACRFHHKEALDLCLKK